MTASRDRTPLPITHHEFERFRDLIHEKVGITLGDNKKYLLQTRLSPLIVESGCRTFHELFVKIHQASDSARLLNVVMDAMTTNETYWFRDQYPFDVMIRDILPEFRTSLQSNGAGKMAIWSAACSTGQEPYSIAMTVLGSNTFWGRERLTHEHVRILATDISDSALDQAIQGAYDESAMRRGGMTEEYRRRFFRREGDRWHVAPEVREMVKFLRINLKDPLITLHGPFDVVFLRNTIIYFSDEFKKTLIERVARILKPGGRLFLGAGESVSGFSDAFRMIDHQGMVYYRLK